jgi:hypothetical protein
MTGTDFEAVAAKLTADIDKLRRKVSAIDQKRRSISLDAMIGDSEARKELDRLNDQRNGKLGEIADLEAAVSEARRRMGEAKAAASLEAAAERARKAEQILAKMAARGRAIDEAIATYCREFEAISEDVSALMALGCPVPTRDLVRVNLRNAHDSATMMLDKTSRPVPPRARRTFSELLQGWTKPGFAWVAARVNNTAQAA